MSSKTFQYLSDINGEPTAHLSGLKKVFLASQDTETALTQFAFGIFEPGEICPRHRHPTMEELFYFMKGEGEYEIGNQIVDIKPGTFLRIPANTDHQLVNSGNGTLEFVYFGIATE